VRVFKSWKGLVAVLAAVAAVSALLVFIFTPRYDPGEATGDDLDIRLAAVWHPDYDDLYDPAGHPAGKTLGAASGFGGGGGGDMARAFIFELASQGEPVQWHRAKVSRAGSVQVAREIDISNFDTSVLLRPMVQARLPMYYDRIIPFDWQTLKSLGWPWQKRVRVEKVDVTLEYWRGPRRGAQAVFQGPFAEGEKKTSLDGRATVILWRYYRAGGIWGTTLALSTSLPGADEMPVLAYTQSGGRCIAHRRDGFRGTAAPGRICLVSDVAPEDIALVTVGERPRQRTFHNITIAYPDRPDLKYPTWINEAAEILDCEDGDVRNRHIGTLDDLLQLASVVRSEGIQMIGWGLPSMLWGSEGAEKIAALETEERETLDAAALSWSRAEDCRIRVVGLSLGLFLDFQAYADRAIDFLHEGDLNTRTSMAQALRQNAEGLTAAHIERIQNVLLTAEPWANMTILLGCLDDSNLPAATRALAELARDQRSAFWCWALQKPEVVALLGARDTWPLHLEARYVAANGIDTLEGEARRREIAEYLSGVLSDRQRIASLRGFRAAVDCLARLLEPAEASEAFIGYLERTRQYTWGSESVGRITQYISRWHGVDIGGLGDDTDAPLALAYARNWRQVRDDVLAWRETGVDPGAALRHARATPGDLRVVSFHTGDPERSVACLWPAPPQGEHTSRVFTVESAGGAMAFSIEPRPAPGDWHYRFVWGVDAEQVIGTSSSFNPASLPFANDIMPPYRLVIEHADSPESVLSGTKVFEQWWEKHAPVEETDDQRAR